MTNQIEDRLVSEIKSLSMLWVNSHSKVCRTTGNSGTLKRLATLLKILYGKRYTVDEASDYAWSLKHFRDNNN